MAWHMWRRSLRAEGDREPSGSLVEDAKAVLSPGGQADVPGEETLWVAALDEYVLPGRNEQAALLVLQALLIHGSLSARELRLVLPLVGKPSIVSVLAKAGFVERKGDLFHCRPAAYPAIRSGLVAIIERPYRPGDWVKIGGDYGQPVVVVLTEQPWGTHYKLRAYPFDMRDQFAFVSDLTVRGKLAIAEAGAREITALANPPSPG